MLHRLNKDQLAEVRHEQDKQEFCFMPVTSHHGWIALAVALPGENGYHELPLEDVRADSYSEMSRYADELNAQIGCSPQKMVKIVAATPHANPA